MLGTSLRARENIFYLVNETFRSQVFLEQVVQIKAIMNNRNARTFFYDQLMQLRLLEASGNNLL